MGKWRDGLSAGLAVASRYRPGQRPGHRDPGSWTEPGSGERRNINRARPSRGAAGGRILRRAAHPLAARRVRKYRSGVKWHGRALILRIGIRQETKGGARVDESLDDGLIIEAN